MIRPDVLYLLLHSLNISIGLIPRFSTVRNQEVDKNLSRISIEDNLMFQPCSSVRKQICNSNGSHVVSRSCLLGTTLCSLKDALRLHVTSSKRVNPMELRES
jgi:hypothetical protein